jgi:hypothetical protein
MIDEKMWEAIEARYGDGSHTSIRRIAEEFGVPEATVRNRVKRDEWCRDTLRKRLDDLRLQFHIGIALLEEEMAKRLTHPLESKRMRIYSSEELAEMPRSSFVHVDGHPVE